MRKLPFFKSECLTRFMVSLLLCFGVLLSLLFTFGAQRSAALALLVAGLLTLLFTALSALRRGRLILVGGMLAAALLQLVLPDYGFFGAAFEAAKAVVLYFNDVPSAAALFSDELALTLAVVLSVVCYAFSSRSVGFLPATILVVMTLFGMWSLEKGQYLWYAAPALIALLLMISQTSHEKINLLEVLPLAAIVVALAMLLVPAGKVVIEPLYESAMSLRQSIIDRFFFTEERNVFTLAAYGYYPLGNRLGGEAEPSEAPVMLVKTDGRTLLRAVSKDEYTGLIWRDTSSAGRIRYSDPFMRSLRESVFLEKLPSQAVRAASTLLDEHAISVQMQNTATSTLFTPVFPRSLDTSGMVAYFNRAGELFTTRDLVRDDKYTVFAPILEGGDSALGSLMAAVGLTQDENYADILKTYTQLPAHLTNTSDAARMSKDVDDIVASSSTPYEKACAIMRHLQRYYRYTLSPDEPPDSQDFVTYFLYVGKEGYCTYFASAMTVMCRMAGLPARYVEGFVAEPSSDGLAYVTGENAHAWTEVYFEGFGWVPFDPTPSSHGQSDDTPPDPPEPTPTPTPELPENSDSDPTPSPEPPPDQPNDEPEPSDQPSQEPDEQQDPQPPDDENSFPWWWLLLAALVLAALIYRVYSRMPNQMAKRETDAEKKIFLYGSAAFTVMKLLKRTPRAGETPLFFARRMDRNKAFPTPILPLWRMMALSHYGRFLPDERQAAEARGVFERLYKPQKPLLKLRFMLLCAFTGSCYTSLDTELAHVEPPRQYSYQAKAGSAGKKNKGRAKKSNGKWDDRKKRPSPRSGGEPARNAHPKKRAVRDASRMRGKSEAVLRTRDQEYADASRQTDADVPSDGPHAQRDVPDAGAEGARGGVRSEASARESGAGGGHGPNARMLRASEDGMPPWEDRNGESGPAAPPRRRRQDRE